MTPMAWRRWHRTAATIAAVPLLLTALTGVAYCWSRRVLGMPKQDVKWLMQVHQGSIVPIARFELVWTAFNALGVVALVLTALAGRPPMLRLEAVGRFGSVNFGSSSWPRHLHQALSAVTLLLLACSAVTGVAYRWGRVVFAAEKERVAILMQIHQGAYVPGLEVVYVSLTGTLTLLMALSGGVLLVRRWLR
eukprot:TRINITY_DN4372_c0_g1_i6.p3 TRINITY_DN4372_c0_g1~~TRINITY_DN4372_c0_g1_i6.p3  ORF type:complete len:192 (-),score=72.76 TRINITY_DN4372_c0_g1_i6:157-732(-)